MMPKIEAPTGKACYQRKSQGLVFAISFELSDGRRVIAPYAYLSHIEMRGLHELIFFYSFSEVRVRGQRLEAIYDLAHAHELNLVCCHDSPECAPGEARVEAIIFKPDAVEEAFS